MFITNITKSTEDRLRQAKFSKVLSYLNAITTLSQRHTGQNQGMGECLQKILCYGPGEELKYILKIFVTSIQLLLKVLELEC